MNLNRFYFTMTLILVTVLLTNYASAIQQLDNEGPIYGECKYYTETVLENGIEVSKKETITAADLGSSLSNFQVLNPDQLICRF